MKILKILEIRVEILVRVRPTPSRGTLEIDRPIPSDRRWRRRSRQSEHEPERIAGGVRAAVMYS
jgi:hypothetical protein